MSVTNPATELLDAHIGQEIPGGCDHCAAVQTVQREDEGIYRMVIAHDDGCPELHRHAKIVPLQVQLDELRRQWRLWHDKDVHELARRDDIDFGEMFPEARGDRVLAARAWRAGILAQLEVIGAELAARIEDEGRRAAR